jgi:hypothetical protein
MATRKLEEGEVVVMTSEEVVLDIEGLRMRYGAPWRGSGSARPEWSGQNDYNRNPGRFPPAIGGAS